MSWRGLLYDLLEPWSRPDQFDLHEALAIAHVFDPQRTGRITREQALQVSAADRAHHARTGTPGECSY